VAGIFRINLWLFGFIVSLGKIGRYVILAYGYSLF
jgi:membrane protein YqaA with SNARE-associated domain